MPGPLPVGKKRRPSHDMGLGAASYIPLAEARELAAKYRKLVKRGIDPIGHLNAQIARNLAADAAIVTFDTKAAAYIQAHPAAWTNPSHAQQWSASLKLYASPVIGNLSVADINTDQAARCPPIRFSPPSVS
jgi:hypothetical protein